MNVCMLGGNLTKDVELKSVGSGKVANFGIAISRQYTKKDGTKEKETVFVDCEAWDKTGEIIAQYFKKGSPIQLRGSIKQDSWEDKTSGTKRTKLKLRVDEFWFGSGPKNKKDGDGEDTSSADDSSAASNEDEGTPF